MVVIGGPRGFRLVLGGSSFFFSVVVHKGSRGCKQF